MVAIGLRRTTARERFNPDAPVSEGERTAAALAATLELVREPAFVLSERGEIRSANAAGLRELKGAPKVEALLLRSALDEGCTAFEVTPLRGSSGTVVGFLAIRRLGSAYVLASREHRVSRAARRWALTRRQSQVLSLIAEGASNARIAAQLGISERTAEDHVAAILSRAAASTRSALLAELLGDV
jgi:DNA-binding CsgD family transcriptional regulator